MDEAGLPGLLAGYGSEGNDNLGANEASDAELDAQVAQFAVALSREGLLPPEEVPAALLARVPTAVEKPEGALDEEACRVAVEAQTLSALLSIFATRGPGLDWAFARLVLVQALQESAAQLETALQRADKRLKHMARWKELRQQAVEEEAARTDAGAVEAARARQAEEWRLAQLHSGAADANPNFAAILDPASGQLDGLTSRQPLFGHGPDHVQVSIEPALDFDEEIEQLREGVGRLKQVSNAIQEENRLTQQVMEGLALRHTSKRLKKALRQSKSNHVLYVFLFAFACLMAVFFFNKLYKFIRWILIASHGISQTTVIFLIKGGVWKNTEDEILKAAVMKYGLNQWARISSLLTRKSAKQCKARWYEWLDPAIVKTEWTREEDEKLLHLAKLMPTQWRTIAPIVGRTPAQCLERYEKLLDMAAGKETYEASDDPRRLRPGEIDPNPESKPARPDPIDMDEDEKEMLSEARARLANTKGKKAKRKARERQLEEARRLATLQKKRELKAAGIEVRERFRRGGAIDYGTEVPFERRPAAGFYDTRDEAGRTAEMREEFRPVTVDELEGRKRKDIERELIKQDARAGPAKRGRLMLPAPAVSDAELEELARGGAAVEEELRASGSAATRGLLGDYATPSRVLRDAAQLAALMTSATPLLGGENPSLEGSDFGGATPAQAAATPAVAGVGATPLRPGATPPRAGLAAPTPVRDALGLNTEIDRAEGKRAEAARLALRRNDLHAGLAQLPAPRNEYAVVVPDLAPEDAAAEAARRARRAAPPRLRRTPPTRPHARAREAVEREAAELRRASRVVQRGLPRPPVVSAVGVEEANGDLQADVRRQAETLVAAELGAMLRHEARRFPLDASSSSSGASKSKKRKSTATQSEPEPDATLQVLDPDSLAAAAALLDAEARNVRAAMGHNDDDADAAALAIEAATDDIVFLPSSTSAEHEVAGRAMAREAARAEKLRGRAEVLTRGLEAREGKLVAEARELAQKLAATSVALACFRELLANEERAAPERLERAATLVREQEALETELQARYRAAGDALAERRRGVTAS
ncbi:hypothetical protein QBZ16_001760 [Prototheca wickerhamii]|uniref:Uncharacterized protein n=1 Tax=Prototheca wickerhamii TaxID=3111 RepID=A0AAD9IG41_PROWI|nr:hypothetical protein QBZ16_001760 [Prototheca wickerhamii]